MITPQRTDPCQRNRIRALGVVASLLVAAVALSACSSQGSSEQVAPSATTTTASSQATASAEPLLTGTWYNGVYHTWDNDGTYYANAKEYYEDGSWYVAGDRVKPFETGTYTFDGSKLTVTTSPGPIHCRADTTGQYVVTFVDADTVTMEAIDDECPPRIDVFTNAPWTRVTELSSNG